MQHVIDNFTSYDLMMLRQDLRARYVENSSDGLADRYGDLIEALIDLYEENEGATDEELLQNELDEAKDEIEGLKVELSSFEDRYDTICQENDELEAENRRLDKKVTRLLTLLGKDEDDDENES